MKKVVLNMQYLEYETDIDEVTCLDKQIIHELYDYFEEIELGYADGIQKVSLSKNAQKMKNVLCVVFREWDKLLRGCSPIFQMGQMTLRRRNY